MPPRALPPLLLLASLSRASFLAGVEWRDFDRAGIVTAVGFVNLTLNAALDHELTLGSNFTVVSSLFSCNVAQRLDPGMDGHQWWHALQHGGDDVDGGSRVDFHDGGGCQRRIAQHADGFIHGAR